MIMTTMMMVMMMMMIIIIIIEGNFLFQRLSVLIQRFNAVLLHDSFVDEEAETGIPA